MDKIVAPPPFAFLKSPIATQEMSEASRPKTRRIFPTGPTLRELYCEKRGLPPDEFVDRFLKETLYPIARLVYPIARFFNAHIDKGDRDLIADLGSCSNRDAIRRTLSRLPMYYDQWTFWRCTGKMRVSSRRIFAIIAAYKFP